MSMSNCVYTVNGELVCDQPVSERPQQQRLGWYADKTQPIKWDWRDTMETFNNATPTPTPWPRERSWIS